jgi:3-deoxy-D-arabino-heptulosonate 7-phosphate (DAHP) synthase class II
MARKWAPDSWGGKPIRQVPEYPDESAMEAVEEQLRFHRALVRVAEGQAFLLQGGNSESPDQVFVQWATTGSGLPSISSLT